MVSTTVLAVLALAVVAQQASAGHLKVSLYAGPPTDDPQCNGALLSCADCNTQVSCLRVNNVLVFTNNVTCSGNTPFCSGVDGSCTSNSTQVDAKCTAPQPVASVQCPSASGYFPDLTSCTKYYICSNWDAYLMDCGAYPNTVYSQRTGTCVPRSSATCFSLSCSRAKQIVAYTPDPNIYAVCLGKSAANAMLAQCPRGQAIDVATGACVPACLSAGRFAVDATTYDECVDLGGNRLSSPVRRACPGQSKFDSASQLCLDDATSTAAASTTTAPPVTP